MHCHIFMRPAAIVIAAATVALLTPAPAGAQTTTAVASPAALPASPSAATAQRPPTCVVAAEKARFGSPLVRTARNLAARQPVKIVALGSSSTYGAGATTSAASYPSRLAEELAERLPGRDITVLNRGVNGDDAIAMLARLDASVIVEKPDLVLWQVGTNSVLRDHPVKPHTTLLHDGLVRLKAIGADIVLIDPQYAPKVIAKPDAEAMVSLIATVAKAENVCLFNRFALMRQWYESDRMPFETFVSPDGLHMNDWSYACLAKWLGAAIAEAATRPTATAGGR
jgi:acyl-CoA thioesterase-1